MKSKNLKKTEGETRQEFWSSLTPKEQLASLDRRLGVGVGAVRQRAMILKRIATPQVTSKQVGNTTVIVGPGVTPAFASKSEEKRVKAQKAARR